MKKKLFDKLTAEIVLPGKIATLETVISEEDSKLQFLTNDSQPRESMKGKVT